MSQPPYATITAHKGHLVCELLVDGDVPGAVASSINNPGRFGQVIMDTSIHLGISAEAVALLKTIKRGRDAIGDVDWFTTADGKAAFCWIGGPKALIRVEGAVGSREYIGATNIEGKYVLVANDVPAEAIEAIEA